MLYMWWVSRILVTRFAFGVIQKLKSWGKWWYPWDGTLSVYAPPKNPLKGDIFKKYPLYKVYIGLITKGNYRFPTIFPTNFRVWTTFQVPIDQSPESPLELVETRWNEGGLRNWWQLTTQLQCYDIPQKGKGVLEQNLQNKSERPFFP